MTAAGRIAASYFSGRRLCLPGIAVILYSVSLLKYVSRDALAGTASGPQGVLELALPSAALALLIIYCRFHGTILVVPRSAVFFGLFGWAATIAASNSPWPVFSLAKSFIFFCVLGIAVLVCSAMGTNETARWLYRTLVLILGLAVLATAALGKDALLYIDEHTGRRYITILATHPSTVADLVAVAFLLGKITRPRPHWATQTVLLVLNLALGSKTSTAILLFIVILSIAVRLPRAVRAVLILTAGASAVAAIMVASTSGYSLGDAALDALQPIYGNRMSEEAATLDGRTELWQVSAELVLRHPLLGFGFDGARRELLASVPWAGHSHNGIVEMLLAGGVLGTMLGLAGWGASATACLRMPANMRWPLISVHLYLFVVALDNPIPMTTQFLGVFLIVWSHACAIEGSSLRAPGLKLSMARS